MKILAYRCVLPVLFAIIGCSGADQDSAGDSFLADGKADDAYGVAEGSPEAVGVLRVANELTRGQLVGEVGLGGRSAKSIDDYRLGDDGVADTGDDKTIDSLKELDDIRYIGGISFERLLEYAEDNGYINRVPDGSGRIAYGETKVFAPTPELPYEGARGILAQFNGAPGDEVYVRVQVLNLEEAYPAGKSVNYSVRLYREVDQELHAIKVPDYLSGTGKDNDFVYTGDVFEPNRPASIYIALPEGSTDFFIGIETYEDIAAVVPVDFEISLEANLPYLMRGEGTGYLDFEAAAGTGYYSPDDLDFYASVDRCLGASPSLRLRTVAFGSSHYHPHEYDLFNYSFVATPQSDGDVEVHYHWDDYFGSVVDIDIVGHLDDNGDTATLVLDDYAYSVDGELIRFLVDPIAIDIESGNDLDDSCYGS